MGRKRSNWMRHKKATIEENEQPTEGKSAEPSEKISTTALKTKKQRKLSPIELGGLEESDFFKSPKKFTDLT